MNDAHEHNPARLRAVKENMPADREGEQIGPQILAAPAPCREFPRASGSGRAIARRRGATARDTRLRAPRPVSPALEQGSSRSCSPSDQISRRPFPSRRPCCFAQRPPNAPRSRARGRHGQGRVGVGHPSPPLPLYEPQKGLRRLPMRDRDRAERPKARVRWAQVGNRIGRELAEVLALQQSDDPLTKSQ